MKKFFSFLVCMSIFLSLVGCAPDLPDPLPDVEAFYARDIKHMEGAAAQLMLDHSMFSAIIEGDSELKQIYRDFVAAYLDDIQISAVDDGVALYPRDSSATVRMDISFVDMPALIARAEEMVQIRHDEYMLTGRMPSKRTDHLFLLESMVEILPSGEIERISGVQRVELEYDKNTGWSISNMEELVEAYIW